MISCSKMQPGTAEGKNKYSADCLLCPSPLGFLRLRADEGFITGLDFCAGPAPGREESLPPLHNHSLLQLAATQLAEYFAGRRKKFDLPLKPAGTPFQQKVWEALCAIPYGETRSYREIAEAVASPLAFRAVGMANHKNPIAIIIPCHRVIGANGTLTGYAGGLAYKQALLALEQGRPLLSGPVSLF